MTGVRSGNGVYEHIDGQVLIYRGQWAQDMRNGSGKMTISETSTFEGTWRNGKIEGTGKLYDATINSRVKIEDEIISLQKKVENWGAYLFMNTFLIPFIIVGVFVVPSLIVVTLLTAEGAGKLVVLFLLFWESIWLTGVCAFYHQAKSMLTDGNQYEEETIPTLREAYNSQILGEDEVGLVGEGPPFEALERMLSSRFYPTIVKIRYELALEPAYMAQMVTSGMKQRIEREATHYR